MKILNVRFKNLNSLVGEWEIDFTQPGYAADGIFAITGPTGAGKTTILDAICLAIYGRTPRLARVTKSGNEIMSRQTGECFAEVTFETQAGRYRCHWAQHRARRKADGELQAPQQEISNADTGEIFEVRKRGVADQIETVTGMDFDRFTRSMMLAQGGFAAFLQAAPDERAPILEQITGTAIYSEISVCVHERQREAQEVLSVLRAELAGIEPLEMEEEQAHREQLAAQEQQAKAIATEMSQVTEAYSWLTGMQTLESDLAKLRGEAEDFQAEIAAFAPQRERLARAQRAALLDGDYASLVQLREQQAQDQAALMAQNQALPELETSLDNSEKAHVTAEQVLRNAKAERKDAEPLLRDVRSLDQSIADETGRVASAQQLCDHEAKDISGLREELRLATARLAETDDSRGRIEGYLKQHAEDQWLVSGYTGVEATLKGLVAQREAIKRLESDQGLAATALERAQQSLELTSAQCVTATRELEGATQAVSQAKAELSTLLDGRLLREYRAEKESLLREMSLLKQIAELEDHRAHLQDGKPCPLCGASEHPYAEGNVPTPDATEERIESLAVLIAQAEEQESVIERRQKKEQSARDTLQLADNDRKLAENQLAGARKDVEAAVATLQNSRREFDAQKQSLERQLRPLGMTAVTQSELDTLAAQLRQRRDDWQVAIREKEGIEQRTALVKAEIQRLETMIEAQGRALATNQERLSKSKEALQRHQLHRASLFGDKQADDVVAALDSSVASAEAAELSARAEHHRLKEKRAAATTRIETLRQRIEVRTDELAQVQAQFSGALSSAEFASEVEFVEARLDSAQRSGLAAEAQALDTRHTELHARIKDRQAQLAREQEKQLSDKSLQELHVLRESLQRQHQDILNAVASVNHLLQKNDEAKSLLSNRQAAIDAQARECRRWGDLHALIGSSDGKKYRKFAQGLTFEMMVGHANRQLQKMSDRYLLVRDPSQPLELNVMDNYQAGEVRSTKNLSGGESFIVSLSLALGLSQMASRNVRVDSLFLDEGFGTLDEEALDTALETLSGLQQEGKLIGVISHVQALKERISTQIQVTPQTGGRSQIAGPGCRRVVPA